MQRELQKFLDGFDSCKRSKAYASGIEKSFFPKRGKLPANLCKLRCGFRKARQAPAPAPSSVCFSRAFRGQLARPRGYCKREKKRASRPCGWKRRCRFRQTSLPWPPHLSCAKRPAVLCCREGFSSEFAVH